MKTSAAILLLLSMIGVSACSPQEPQQVSLPELPAPQASPAALTQSELQRFADNLKISYRVLTNVSDDQCARDRAGGRCFQAEISLTSSFEFSAADWRIYFSQMRPVQSLNSSEFIISHIQGDLHSISPSAGFSGFKAGETKVLLIRADFWQLSEVDAMPNYYLVAPNLQPVVIASTQLQQDPETGLEVRPYMVAFTDEERQFKRSPEDNLPWAKANVIYERNQDTPDNAELAADSLLPTPLHQELLPEQAPVDLKKGISPVFIGTQRAPVAAALARLARLGVREDAAGVALELVSDPSLASEGYRLDIAAGAIKISAAGAAGFSYGLSSLASLLDPDSLQVSAMRIRDEPHYGFRGLHLDLARNFHSKQLLLKLIDAMAAYKLNRLHLHLADDEGWRLEIDGLPELTDIGSKRCHDLAEDSCLLPQLGSGPDPDSAVNGFLSMADYVELLQFAAVRQIQVIPSMDMPGHSRAAIKAMEARYRRLLAKGDSKGATEYRLLDPEDKTQYSSVQYYNDNTLNVCLESTFHFVDKVIDEVTKLHQSAGVPLQLYHIGADETAGAWLESPACEALLAADSSIGDKQHLGAYFIERVSTMLASKGITPAGWSDGLGHVRADRMPAKVQSNSWDLLSHQGHRVAHRQANLGWQLVLSTPEVLYFDFPYEADPKEHGYYWGARQNNSRHLFNFMTDNLPANAEQWTDIENRPYSADDRSTAGEQVSEPLRPENRMAGIQGQIWSETLRSDELVEYMAFPRLLMLAERAWHKPDWQVPYQYQGAIYNADSGFFSAELKLAQAQDWYRIANLLGHKELKKLDLAGIGYRIPTVGARISEGRLYTNLIFPGLGIEYRLGECAWQTYQGSIEVGAGPVQVRAVGADGKRRGRSLQVQ
ncbi:family 20 glycosylhydrolase [Shewanella sedimentimangrovi]|nr:family 20 glycosylhydrolase [Shewanella sedimentimangrovi]